MLTFYMIRTTTSLILLTLLLSACVNKHGISMKYYSNCKEYYDLQGYYHNECGKDDIITYKKVGETATDAVDFVINTKKEKGNVY